MAKKPNDAPAVTPPHPGLPEQLRKQLAQADEIRAGMNGNEPPAQPQEPPAPPQPTNPTPPPAQPQQPQQPPAAATPPEPEETLEQKYRSQSGRLEQALRANQAMADRMAQLEQQIAQLAAAGAQPPQPQQPPPAPQKPKLVTPEEEQDFGPDLLDVVGRRAREEYAPEFEQLAERLRRLEGRVDGAAQVIELNQKKTLYQELGEKVPNWKEVNRSPEFMDWLQHTDQFSGRRRNDLLQEAFSRQEASRVVAFFQGFLTEATGLPQQPQARTPSAPPLAQPGNGSGKPSLEDFAAPGRARSAPQELPPDKPVYTTAWIDKFMADKRRGVYRGREADAEAIERDIYQAQHEGRIQ